MSLINEALKKAQRLRTDEPAGETPPVPGGGAKIAKRAQARSTSTTVLIVSGAIVLVVLSVIATVFLLNPPSAPVAVASAGTGGPAPIKSDPTAATSVPVIVAPAITPPPAPIAIAPAPVAAATPSAVVPAPPENPKPTSTPAATPGPAPTAPVSVATTATTKSIASPPEPTPPPKAVAARPDDRVTAFVEAVRVTGIRSSGADSRVLMNDRVYRVNDVVDRTLNIRLVKVAVDSLTFADAQGVTYVKYF